MLREPSHGEPGTSGSRNASSIGSPLWQTRRGFADVSSKRFRGGADFKRMRRSDSADFKRVRCSGITDFKRIRRSDSVDFKRNAGGAGFRRRRGA